MNINQTLLDEIRKMSEGGSSIEEIMNHLSATEDNGWLYHRYLRELFPGIEDEAFPMPHSIIWKRISQIDKEDFLFQMEECIINLKAKKEIWGEISSENIAAHLRINLQEVDKHMGSIPNLYWDSPTSNTQNTTYTGYQYFKLKEHLGKT